MNQFTGFLWFVLMLAPLIYLQRLLHREIQAVLLILSRNPRLTMVVFQFIFLPGVFIHEGSHFVMAKILRVPTGRFSILPKALSNGRLQLGYVETARSDIIRDSIIGAAPLITGTICVAYIAFYQLNVRLLLDVLREGQLNLFWLAVTDLPNIKGFYLWFYLAFTISSTMMPSESDRHAWAPLGIWVALLLGLDRAAAAEFSFFLAMPKLLTKYRDGRFARLFLRPSPSTTLELTTRREIPRKIRCNGCRAVVEEP